MTILLPLLFLFCERPNHALHLATLQIMQDENLTKLQLTVFKDDCQDALKNAFPNTQINRNEDFCQLHQTELEQYFSHHLKLQFDDKTVALNFTEAIALTDVYQLHFTAKIPVKWQVFAIRADYFLELFSDQTNTIVLQLLQDQQQRWLKTNRNQIVCKGMAF